MEDQNNDSSESTNETAAPAVDEIGNLKADTNRRFDALADQLRQLTEITRSQPQPLPTKQEQVDLKSLMYDDPDRYTRIVEERATSRATEAVNRKMAATQTANNKIAEIQSQYPEFRDGNSEVYRKANQLHGSLPEHLQGTPEGIEIAMLRAATSQGLVPASSRKTKTSDDDFSISSKGTRRPTKEDSELSQATKEFAALIAETTGRDINDPKLQAGLKAANKRNFKRFE